MNLRLSANYNPSAYDTPSRWQDVNCVHCGHVYSQDNKYPDCCPTCFKYHDEPLEALPATGVADGEIRQTYTEMSAERFFSYDYDLDQVERVLGKPVGEAYRAYKSQEFLSNSSQ